MSKAEFHPRWLVSKQPLTLAAGGCFAIGKREFHSAVAMERLAGRDRVYIFVATAGAALSPPPPSASLLDQYGWDREAYQACEQAVEQLKETLRQNLDCGQLCLLCPGAVPDWDIRELRGLIEALEGDEQAIGVGMTEAGMLTPLHTLAGILIPGATEYEHCAACPRLNCPERNKG